MDACIVKTKVSLTPVTGGIVDVPFAITELPLDPIAAGRLVVNDAFHVIQGLVDHVLEVAAAALVSGFSDLIHQVRKGEALLALGKNPLNDRPQ